MFFTSSPGDQRKLTPYTLQLHCCQCSYASISYLPDCIAVLVLDTVSPGCYLNSAYVGRMAMGHGVTSASLTSHIPPAPPPPPPPPPATPLTLIFSVNAPSPVGGSDAVVIGNMTLVDGTQVLAGGAESGLYGTSHSGPWCDFSSEFKLPKSLPGAARARSVHLTGDRQHDITAFYAGFLHCADEVRTAVLVRATTESCQCMSTFMFDLNCDCSFMARFHRTRTLGGRQEHVASQGACPGHPGSLWRHLATCS